MRDLRHRVALVDRAGRLVRGPVEVDGVWPSPRELRGAAEALDAVEIVPAWPEGVEVTHLLRTRAEEGRGEPWGPAVAPLALRSARGGGWPGWYLPGWRAGVDAWIADALARADLVAAGTPEIVTWWSLSAVLRIPVTGTEDGAVRDVWFKATCEGFRDEAAITARLAEIGGDLIPGVLSLDAERAWMLLEDVPGAGEEPDLPTVLAAARAMSALQVRLAERAVDLPLPRRDVPATLAALHALIDDSVEGDLMPASLPGAARAVEPEIARRLRELDAMDVPATLVHGDLHTQNLAGTPEHPVIFDWTDACIGHPYLDGILLARSAAGRGEGEQLPATARAVRDAYLSAWREARPDIDHDLVWERAALLDDVFQMITYEQIVRAQAPGSRWELGGVVAERLQRLVDEVAVGGPR